MLANAFNTTNRELIIELAVLYRVPAIYFSAYCAQSGGLIGYGSDYLNRHDKRRDTLTASSEAPSPRTFRCKRQPSLSW